MLRQATRPEGTPGYGQTSDSCADRSHIDGAGRKCPPGVPRGAGAQLFEVKDDSAPGQCSQQLPAILPAAPRPKIHAGGVSLVCWDRRTRTPQCTGWHCHTHAAVKVWPPRPLKGSLGVSAEAQAWRLGVPPSPQLWRRVLLSDGHKPTGTGQHTPVCGCVCPCVPLCVCVRAESTEAQLMRLGKKTVRRVCPMCQPSATDPSSKRPVCSGVLTLCHSQLP